MKQSSDGIAIVPRMWYYLLDWKDSHLTEFEMKYDTLTLSSLTYEQICELFRTVVEYDLIPQLKIVK